MVRILVIATRNQGKVGEIRTMLEELDFDVRSATDFPGLPEVEETGATFADNAAIKALAVAGFTGALSLADDSGLEVDALGALPGVQSARFAGPGATDEVNNAKLLAVLEGIPDGHRQARFKCVVALALPGRPLASFEGVCEGKIGLRPRGSNGFGYDPLFLVSGHERTMAELTLDEKNRLSHRARALKQAVEWLKCGWEL